ncbi:MAG: ATP-binding cassette domain-containing protein [Anaerolineae bacterium]|nr:ATP-binding cassette domain-containing protein [Anaerolineae bacterium]
MPVLELTDVTVLRGGTRILDRVTWRVEEGERWVILGPNGAGKTTIIRIIMDILQPDEGEVTVLGYPPGVAKDRVGYLPEERGLWQKLRVLDTLIYLAQLKGMGRSTSQERARRLLRQMDLEEWEGHKVRDLSRGMQQRLQFIASLVHNPDLVFLDEPFQGQDPINVQRLKNSVGQLRDDGKTVVLSTHQMNLVEELCDRILLINRGKALLYGALKDIKQTYALNTVLIKTPVLPADLPGVLEVKQGNGAFNLLLSDNTHPQSILRALLERDIEVTAFEVAPAPLADIFVKAVRQEEA